MRARALAKQAAEHAGINIEPLPADHPLTKLPNVTLSAHSAFRTPEASEKLRKGNYERLFDEARRLIRRLPEAPEELAELKQKLLGQIGDAEQQHKVHAQIESAIEESKKLVEKYGQTSDILEVIKTLCEIRNGRGVTDDIDQAPLDAVVVPRSAPPGR